MLFCSQAYLLFFVTIFALYWATPWQRTRVWLLLVASFFFYACWNHWLACLIGFSTFIDFWLAGRMESSSSRRGRKFLLVISVVGNLGLLCYFKYANFFLESLEAALDRFGVQGSMPTLSVIVPIGISFYTFEAINYMVDVYRRKIPAERSLANFMLFITFFPHLVAGPIVRARDFLPQIHRPKRWNWARLHLGVQFLLMGMFKKLAVADRMACLVDPVFENPDFYPTHTLWLAMIGYALQVYGDFSGYTDMAIGSAHLLGYKLAQNFNMPYLARNIAEFWRRWHISLSSWLRDYLYFPLGGSRRGPWITCRNLMIVMTIAGLWHGAAWNYVLFGVIHGLLLSGYLFFHKWKETKPALNIALTSAPGTAACVMMTFTTFCLTLVVFRSHSLESAGVYFQGLFSAQTGLGRAPIHPISLLLTLLVVAMCHGVALRGWHRVGLARMPAPVVGASYAVLLTFILVLAPASAKAFIYFQF